MDEETLKKERDEAVRLLELLFWEDSNTNIDAHKTYEEVNVFLNGLGKKK